LQEAGRNAFHRYEEVEGQGQLYRVYVGEHDEREGAELEGRILKALNLVPVFWIRAIPRGIGGNSEEGHSRQGYALHVSSFRLEDNAAQEVRRLAQEGHSAWHRRAVVANETWFRVYLGGFPDQQSAEEAGGELKDEGIISFYRAHRVQADVLVSGVRREVAQADVVPAPGARPIPEEEVSRAREPDTRSVEEEGALRSEALAMSRSAIESVAKTPPRADGGRKLQFDFRGQLSAWALETRDRGTWWSNSGVRYIPQLRVKKPFGSGSAIDLEASANSFAAYQSGDQDRDPEVELYRLKLRYSGRQTEARVGLQKINFGPGYLLRPLRWFDQLDPRDPLQLTEGVWGLRCRYDGMNNASLWLWALYGNGDLKGYEAFPTSSGIPEFGWRVQYPALRGEIAATLHTRRVDADAFGVRNLRENRFALDARWDIGVGLWVESVFQHQDSSVLPYEWQKMVSLGMDYTLGIGSGLHVLGEHMTAAFSTEPFQWDEDFQTSAFSLSYSIGFFDGVTAVGYYNWDARQYGQYLSWQRTYDHFIIQLSGFHYPQSTGDDVRMAQSRLGVGYGGQLQVIYNH